MSEVTEKSWAHFDLTSFEQVHKGILDLLPKPPAKILDVGAGTGRDSRALSELGYQVTAVEPAPQLFKEASSRSSPLVEWINDRLPELRHLGDRQFDFVLVSAVWMYLAPQTRQAAMHRLSSLLRPQGALAITTRPPQQTDNPADLWDATTEEVEQAANSAGLEQLRLRTDADSLGRDISWTTYVFKRLDGARPRRPHFVSHPTGLSRAGD